MSRPAIDSRSWRVVLLLGIFLVSVNLRAGLIAVPPLLSAIRASTGLSPSATGIVLALPPLCYAGFSLVAPRVANRIGIDFTVIVAILVLAAGILLRSTPPVAMLFLGTVVMGMAIAHGNVLVPALIKRDFPERLGLITALYGMGMALGGTVAAAVVVPLSERTGFSWRGTLSLLAIPAVLTAFFLLPRLRRDSRVLPERRVGGHRVGLWRDLMAWQISICMGLQSFLFYGLGTWTPSILIEHGISEAQAGVLWSICNLGNIPASFLAPLLFTRRGLQRPLMLTSVAMFAITISGMAFAPLTLTWLWMVLLGTAASIAFGGALILIVQRSPDYAHASALSGMAQALGYGVSAAGPFLVGVVHDLTGSWEVPILMLFGILAIFAWAALGACRPVLVGQFVPES